MANLDLVKENEKQLRIDENNYRMFEETKRETIKELRKKCDKNGNRLYSDDDIEEKINTIQEAQNEVVEDYISRGGNEEDLITNSKKVTTSSKSLSVQDYMKAFEKQNVEFEKEPYVAPSVEIKDKPTVNNNEVTNIPESETVSNQSVKVDIDDMPIRGTVSNGDFYDKIPLPSKGECYPNKMNTIPVSYLTANDENMIVSPNLYRDNAVIDAILEEKVLSQIVKPCDLLEGDRDAIVLFLRATGYGNEYPITATDDKTGEEFNTVIDLSKIEYKPFNLKSDSCGWFDYTLPVSKKEIKFRFLTHKDNLILNELEQNEDKTLKKTKIDEMVETLTDYISNDEVLDKQGKSKVREGINALSDWSEKLSEEEGTKYTHAVTNRLEMCIMAVDGITKRDYISEFVKSMNVKDSSSLRKYIKENEPGLDFNIEIEKPERLGGGVMEVFLQLDQYVFLNVVA